MKASYIIFKETLREWWAKTHNHSLPFTIQYLDHLQTPTILMRTEDLSDWLLSYCYFTIHTPFYSIIIFLLFKTYNAFFVPKYQL